MTIQGRLKHVTNGCDLNNFCSTTTGPSSDERQGARKCIHESVMTISSRNCLFLAKGGGTPEKRCQKLCHIYIYTWIFQVCKTCAFSLFTQKNPPKGRIFTYLEDPGVCIIYGQREGDDYKTMQKDTGEPHVFLPMSSHKFWPRVVLVNFPAVGFIGAIWEP